MTYRRDWNEIRDLLLSMMQDQGPIITKMRDILHRYDGEWVIPIPDAPDEPRMPNLMPALVGEAVDFLAQRAASVAPMVSCPALEPHKDRGVRSREYATIRRRALHATYDDSMWELGRRRFFRHMSAYHAGAIFVQPDFYSQIPRIQARDPLSTYAEPQAAEELRPPHYVGFVTRFSGTYLCRRFPQAHSINGGPVTGVDGDQMWDVVEWVDDEQIQYGLVGPVNGQGRHVIDNYENNWGHSPSMPLGPSFDNKAGMVTGVVPHNVSLGRIASRIGSLLGNIDMQARLTALNVIAMERAVFPDVYAIGTQTGTPSVVGGAWKDGRTMEINLLADTTSVGLLRQTPDPAIRDQIASLERNVRVSSGLVPQAGGETYGALRTGRGIDALAGMALDPKIQEMHEIDQAWMRHLNRAIFGVYKGYFGAKQFSMFSGWPQDRGLVEFVPNTHFETDANSVTYAIPGADITQATQILGSLQGTGAISRRSFRERHPWIGDPEQEGHLADEEQFEDALKQTLLMKLQDGSMPIQTLSMVRKAMQDGMDIFDAYDDAQRKAQELQATAAPPAPEGMLAPPEAMLGLEAGPGALAQPMEEVPPGAPIEPFENVGNMRELMTQMGAA